MGKFSLPIVIMTELFKHIETLPWICLQVFIICLEMAVRLHVTSKSSQRRRRGYFLGMTAQVPWAFVFISCHLWYLLPLLLIDGAIWGRGFLSQDSKFWGVSYLAVGGGPWIPRVSGGAGNNGIKYRILRVCWGIFYWEK